MTSKKFKQYKIIANDVLDLLIDKKCSSLRDIKIIYNIIMGFPFCLDEDGHYTYDGQFYNSIDELPLDAHKDLLCRLAHNENV